MKSGFNPADVLLSGLRDDVIGNSQYSTDFRLIACPESSSGSLDCLESLNPNAPATRVSFSQLTKITGYLVSSHLSYFILVGDDLVDVFAFYCLLPCRSPGCLSCGLPGSMVPRPSQETRQHQRVNLSSRRTL